MCAPIFLISFSIFWRFFRFLGVSQDMDGLNSDVLQYIASMGVATAIKLGLICKRFREAVEDGEGKAFETRSRLVAIQETSLQKDLVAALALSPINVKLGPHTRKRNRYGGYYHIFTHATAVAIFLSHGGFERLETRVQRKARGTKSKLLR